MSGFDWTDYAVFVLMLLISAFIGIYFGCFGTKQRSPLEYLLAGKSMGPVPVALSLLAGSISAIMLIGTPSEVYTENPTYYLETFGQMIGCAIAYRLYIPIFQELNLNTSYEYLEMRFSKIVRSIVALFYSVSYLFYLPIVVYIPSLALSLGLNIHVISSITTAVCIFYTTIGGLKAVIWTDFVQMVIAIIACIAIVIIGTINAGGFIHVMRTSYYDGKLNIFNMDPSPLIRMSFWNALVGGTVESIAIYGVWQGNIQRYQSLKSPKQLPLVLLIYFFLYWLISTICTYEGLLMYAVYYGCDPIEQKIVPKDDQIFPHYVIDKIGYVPALPGMFISGIFSAALSTLSTGFNTITQVIYNDYVKSRISADKSHAAMMSITFSIGLFTIGGVIVVERLGKVLASSYIISAMTWVPVFVVFTLGIMVPPCNTKGAIAGLLSTCAFITWTSVGTMVSEINLEKSPVYPEDKTTCPFNQTDLPVVTGDVFPLYRLSFMLYTAYGLLVGLFFGIVTSYITGPTKFESLNPKLISPPLRRFLPKNNQEISYR